MLPLLEQESKEAGGFTKAVEEPRNVGIYDLPRYLALGDSNFISLMISFLQGFFRRGDCPPLSSIIRLSVFSSYSIILAGPGNRRIVRPDYLDIRSENKL